MSGHQHEDWQLQDDGSGRGVYCAACGEHLGE